MDLVLYIRLVRKWWWLLFLGAFLASGITFVLSSSRSEQYEAKVLISVGSFIQAPNPDSAEIRTGVELAQTYAVLAETFDVLEAAVEAGNLPVSPAALRGALKAEVVDNTSLLSLTVTYTDPVLAADMANEVALQLILNSPSNLTAEQQAQIDLANAQIAAINQELQQARQQLSDIDTQLAATTDPAVYDQLMAQRNTIVNQINQASANIAQFSNTITTLQQRSNSLDIVERARIPTAPKGIGVVSRVMLGAVVGSLLAAGVAMVIEYLDDTLRTAEQATETLTLPTLASITRFGSSRDSASHRLITYHNPGSPIAEEYRALRINLMFSAEKEEDNSAFIVTSPGPSEGKSTTIANLAVTMAMAGLRVLLVDADLRRPMIHELFELDNRAGLSTLLFANPNDDPDNEQQQMPRDLTGCLQSTGVPGLRVITSGHIPLNPTEALGSTAMQHWFHEFRASPNVDVVLFDTPPTLLVADCSALASAIDAQVVLVLEAGRTRRSAALKAAEQLANLDVPVKGVVLNAVNPRDQGYGNQDYSYYYYYRRETPDGQARPHTNRNE
ncbi:MAG: polysaccharide biosynthesis tyrosine autokinase [Anaerolineae bacterium]|nr:polysaccharide biosynthesis tyrosine autokinase [Anaerolineae bacterium]